MATATITTGQGVAIINYSTVTSAPSPTELGLGRTGGATSLKLPVSIPSGIRKKNITKLTARVYFKGTLGSLNIYSLREPYSATTETGTTTPSGRARNSNYSYAWSDIELAQGTEVDAAGGGLHALENGILFSGYSVSGDYLAGMYVYPGGSTYSPTINATYENAVLYAAGVSPASGYVNNHEAITFSWTPKTDAKTIDPLSQASAVFRWKDGASGTVHTVNVGTDEFVTLAADTLPNSSEIMWQVQLTSDDGVQDPSPAWYTVTTIDATPTVTGISPSGGYVSGSDTATFRWNYDISTGTQQSAWELQVKAAAADNWTDYASGSTSDTEVTVSGSGLPSGNAMWRVRGANSDSVWSDWSDPLTYVTVAPPRPPVVSITERTARPTVTWTSSDQQAFRVNIGDYDSGIVFGTDKTFKCPVYLKNGEITIRVKVVNDLNLWSDWGETVFQLSAAQGTAPTLYVTGGVSAGLSWTTSDSPDGFLVYRDGVLIGETAGEGGGGGSTAETPSDPDDWEAGSFVTSYGTEANSETNLRTRIRTKSAGVPTDVTRIRAETGYKFFVYGWNGSTYLGGWKAGSGSFTTASMTNAHVTDVDTAAMYAAGATKLRLCLMNDDASTDISTSAAEHVIFYREIPSGAVTYTDQLAAPGYHSWFVRSVYDGSDAYADSAAVQAEIAVGTNVIAELGGEWIDIGLSAVQAPTETETRGAAVAMLTLAGAIYPVPEVGPQRTRTMPVSFATLDPAAADRFCALEGKIVVCKTRHGRQIIGIMPSITRGQNWAMTTCSAVIQEVDESAYR